MSSESKGKTTENGQSEYALESILAEFKGTAYIDGDKRTPKNELDQKADQIVYEVTGRRLSAEVSSFNDASEEDEAFDALVQMVGRHPKQKTDAAPHADQGGAHAVSREISDEDTDFFERFMYAHPGTSRHFTPVEQTPDGAASAQQEEIQAPEQDEQRNMVDEPDAPPSEQSKEGQDRSSDDEEAEDWLLNFERRRRSRQRPAPEQADSGDAAQPVQAQADSDVPPGAYAPDWADGQPQESQKAGFWARLFGHARYTQPAQEQDNGEDDGVYETEEVWEEPEEEPDLLKEARRFATGVRMLSIRTCGAFFISFVMLFFTFFYESKGVFPFGIGGTYPLLAGIMAIMLLLVMALAIDVLLDGVTDLIHGEPGGETLATFAAFISIICAMALIGSGDERYGLPVCIVPAFSLCYAMRGKRLYRTAMANSLSAASSKAVKYGIISDSGTIEDRSVLKKIMGKTGGFYRQIVQADISERIYSVAVPLLMIAALVFSAVTAFGGHGLNGFLYALSAMLAISASFTAFTAFPLPFETVARKTKNSGGVVAGWGGASAIHDAGGAIITDDDVFPIGTVTLQSYRVTEGFPEHKAIAYASSLIVASGSGLSKVFSELMRGMGLAMARVEDFACYEGGIGATIRGEPVLVGTAGFMNLMSVRIPGGIHTSSTLFAAIGGELVALFVVNYMPANSVQNALVALIRTRAPMIFAVKDFNVTPAMLRQKFKVSIQDIEYIPSKDCYRLSDDRDAERYDTAAVIFREGLGPFADLIRRGRRLHTLTLLASILSVAGAYIGVLLLFALCWLDAYVSASALNIIFYMLAMHLPLMAIVKRIAGGK